MGSSFQITVVVLHPDIGFINIQEAATEIKRIESVISPTIETSETSLVNKNAGIQPVKVSDEFFKLVEKAIHYSEISNGSFDITYAVLEKVWRFDGTMQYLPLHSEVEALLPKINYKKIILDKAKRTVFLKEKGMRISFSAMAKGYAIDRVKELLISKEVTGGMINASGDVTSWGRKVGGKKWVLGVRDTSVEEKPVVWYPLLESSASYAGMHDKYIAINNLKYSYIINPKTGYPVDEVKKVIVFSKTAELSDAYATMLFVLGKERGIALINETPETEAMLVDTSNTVFKSKGL